MMIGVDLGSNTIRAIQIECKTKKRVKEYQKVVGLAKGLRDGGEISKEAKSSLFEALKEIREEFDFDTEKYKCITTEAMRVAKNSQEILDEIRVKFGLNFEIIDGKKEAEYTLIGVKNVLDKNVAGDFCMFDLGGGSTEISYIEGDSFESMSFPFGILNIATRYKEDIREGILKEISLIDEFIKDKKAPYLVATAGTPTTVCSYLQGMDYKSYDYRRVNGKKLSIDDYKRAYKEILGMPINEQERFCGIRRSKLIESGILIVIEIMKKLGFDESIVIDDGLREGLALSLCEKEVNDG